MLRSFCRQWLALAMLLVLSMLTLALSGCASWQTPAEFDDAALRARAKSDTVNGVSLKAAVLSSSDSQQIFGVDVNNSGVQPVWIEVINTTDQALWLLRSGVDPDLFSPLEVAWSFHESFAGETNARLDEHFDSLNFQNPIAPGATQSGILFTNPHRHTRLLSIDILGQKQLFPFTLFPPVPDDATGSTTLSRVNQLTDAVNDDYQHADKFRARLEQLPCCATSADGTDTGDPLNVVLVGEIADIATALVRRDYRMDVLAFDKAQHLFGRPPDIVARKAGQAGTPANWLRLWVAPLRFQGKAVFLVQAGRPQGWRYTVSEEEEEEEEDKDLRLHPNVDEARNLLIQDLLYSSGLEKIAFATGVGATGAGESRHSPGGGSYHTDGLRAVLFLVTRPLSLSDIEILEWHPVLKLHEIEAAREYEHGEN